MNGTLKDSESEGRQDVEELENDVEDVVEDVDPEHTIVMDTDVEAISDETGELNVEELVAKLDNADYANCEEKRAIKARLDELADRKMTEEELGSTYTFDLDEDV